MAVYTELDSDFNHTRLEVNLSPVDPQIISQPQLIRCLQLCENLKKETRLSRALNSDPQKLWNNKYVLF